MTKRGRGPEHGGVVEVSQGYTGQERRTGDSEVREGRNLLPFTERSFTSVSGHRRGPDSATVNKERREVDRER